jgi:pimeloyl-ACP methyl ester carboxylesterase
MQRRDVLKAIGTAMAAGLPITTQAAQPPREGAAADALAHADAGASAPGGSRIRQRFVNVGGRQVRYLRAGSGSPVVMAHGTPGNANMLVPQIDFLSPKYTCFAFDTPGLGGSDALHDGPIAIAELADAMADAMRALKLPKCAAFGTHTGAALVLELARRHPDLITGAYFLGGVPIFNAEDRERLGDKYLPPVVIDELGGHLTSSWTRFRDQFIWFPWDLRSPRYYVPHDLLSDSDIHDWVVSIFRARKTFRPVADAAVHSGVTAPGAAAALRVPAVFACSPTDVLYPHLDRLPPLKPDQKIVRLTEGPEQAAAIFSQAMAQFDGHGAAPADSDRPRDCATIQKHFVDLPESQVLVRHCGALGRRKIVLLHDAPGSALALEPLIAALGRTLDVYALDLPGCGESGPLTGEAPAIDAYVEAVHAVCATLRLEKPAFYGIGFGASVAAEFVARFPERASRLAVNGVLLPDPEERKSLRQNYAPPVTLQPGGGHWYQIWLMVRDSLAYWPWYNRAHAAQRQVESDFGGEAIHNWMFEVVKQFGSYHHVINAAIDADAGAALARVKSPVLVCDDPSHRFSVYAPRLAAALPHAAKQAMMADPVKSAATIAEFVSAG